MQSLLSLCVCAQAAVCREGRFSENIQRSRWRVRAPAPVLSFKNRHRLPSASNPVNLASVPPLWGGRKKKKRRRLWDSQPRSSGLGADYALTWMWSCVSTAAVHGCRRRRSDTFLLRCLLRSAAAQYLYEIGVKSLCTALMLPDLLGTAG